MAYTLEQAYEIGRESARLEHVALARTLTNNPAPGVLAALDTEALAMQTLLVAGFPNTALVTDGTLLTVDGGSVTLNVTNGVISATYTPDA